MNLDNFNNLIDKSSTILLIQADNPDGDSLASCLALESIFATLNKSVIMYCGVEVPTYLRHIEGWDRVVHEIPKNFDLSIIIDCSSLTLLETMQKNGEISWVKSKPSVILDHHSTKPTIDFASDVINLLLSSTGELIYKISSENNWEVSQQSAYYLAVSILSDTLGLTTESVTDKTFLTMSELVKRGINLAKIDENRRKSNKKSLEIVKYKAKLLDRIDTSIDKRVATIDIPWPEIEKYSHEYNPPMLVMDEMRMINDVLVVIAFKTYPDGKITAKIRTNFGVKIADKLAEHFGGGGHQYASGFKIQGTKDFNEAKLECIKKAITMLDEGNFETL